MITVQYLNPPRWASDLYGDDLGRVFFDINEDFRVRMTKALDRLKDTEQVSQEAALANTLEGTAKNTALLEKFAGNTMKRQKEPIDIEVVEDGERLPLSGAAVLGYTENSEESDFEFEMYSDDWIDKIESVNVSEVNLGTFLYTKQNVLNAWGGERDQLAIPMLADYGKWTTPGNVTRRDLRFWFNLNSLMKEVFCSVGWTFNSPHYEEGNGRFAYGYLSSQGWASYPNKQTENFVHLDITEPQEMPAFERIPIWNEVFDPLNRYNNLVSIPSRPDEYFYPPIDTPDNRLRIELRNFKVRLPPPPQGQGALSLFVIVVKNNNGELEFLGSERFIAQTVGETRITVDATFVDPDMTSGDSYAVSYFYSNELGALPWTIESGELYFRPDPEYIDFDDDVPLAALIDEELTGMELFKGMAHLCNGKVFTDLSTKTVTLYPPYSYERIGDGKLIEGFFQENRPTVDLREQTDPDFFQWESNETDRDRFVQLKFANSDDVVVSKGDKGERWTRRVDLGSGKSNTRKIENEIFQTTYSRFIDSDLVGGQGCTMAVVKDNEDGESSTEPGFRVGIFYGDFIQDGPGFNRSINFEGQETYRVPYMAQVPTIPLPANVNAVPLSFSGYKDDLYQLHYRFEIEKEDDGIRYKFRLNGGNRTYNAINFRREVIVAGKETPHLVRPISLKDYDWGSNDPIEFNCKPIRSRR